MTMCVVEEIEEREIAVDTACADDRDLPLEIDEGLEHRLTTTERPPRRDDVGVLVDGDLPFSVVAECGSLQHGRPADAVGAVQ